MLDIGIKGWMADFGEYLPVDAVLRHGDPKKLHNLWPVLWAKVNREAVEEYGAKDAMFFMRSGYLGIQTYAPVLWNGDQHTDLTRDYGMPCVMPASFSLGFSHTAPEEDTPAPWHAATEAPKPPEGPRLGVLAVRDVSPDSLRLSWSVVQGPTLQKVWCELSPALVGGL